MAGAAKPQCGSEKETAEYDLGLHVTGLFLVLAASCIGCGFPVVAKKVKWMKVPPKVFFACKHFGTGVLIATAFVHLLPTAFGSLGNPCLPDLFVKDYPPLPGVIMMGSLFALFVIELWLNAKTGGHTHGGPTGEGLDGESAVESRRHHGSSPGDKNESSTATVSDFDSRTITRSSESDVSLDSNGPDESGDTLPNKPAWLVAFYDRHVRKQKSITNSISPRSHKKHNESVSSMSMTISSDEENQDVDPQVFRKMSINITLLEGGILFHSVFVGMTVSITIDGFVVLLIAILFHQIFEGLGLGSRIAAVPYPKKSYRPWLLVFAFGTTAPFGQAIGLLARNSYDPNSALGLVLVGVFNSISSGLLIYAALVDLLAEDFLSSEANHLMNGRKKAFAFAWVLAGAVGMAIVGAFA